MPESVLYALDSLSNQYINDRGQANDWIGVVKVPEDLSRGQVEAFVNAMGGRSRTETIPCSVRGYLRPRYAEFIRAKGHVIRFPIYGRASMAAIVRAGRNSLNASSAADNQVICIKVHGEEYPNMYDDVVTSPAPPAPVAVIAPPAGYGKTKLNFSGVLNQYRADTTAVSGGNILMPFLMMTDTVNAVPSTMVPAAGCLNSVSDIFCPVRQWRVARHYIPTILTVEPNLPQQSMKIPVSNNAAAQIEDCGRNLANLPHVICLAYKGESNNRYHLVL